MDTEKNAASPQNKPLDKHIEYHWFQYVCTGIGRSFIQEITARLLR